jgi:hypothetical protein
MIFIDQKKQILLDKVVYDLPKVQMNLYEHISDMNLWFNYLIADRINLVEFSQLVLNDFNIKKEEESQQIFIAILMDIFGDVDTWLEIPINKMNKLLIELHLALSDIEIAYLQSRNSDYELLMTLMEEELQDDRQ